MYYVEILAFIILCFIGLAFLPLIAVGIVAAVGIGAVLGGLYWLTTLLATLYENANPATQELIGTGLSYLAAAGFAAFLIYAAVVTYIDIRDWVRERRAKR